MKEPIGPKALIIASIVAFGLAGLTLWARAYLQGSGPPSEDVETLYWLA